MRYKIKIYPERVEARERVLSHMTSLRDATRPRKLLRVPMTMTGDGGAGGAFDVGTFFTAGFGAACFLAAGFFFGSGVSLLGLASS